ncbi:TIGR03016 family PEP-CTERM system-associated outer membrane protein [Geoalkalibacter halelectricus]|uniref:TIGR03016 family PEP-CTERM system-associated outer membrane protein n=1 Tax=Geoalkalibacter halelectricus TaxID=2847045 RepID=UPI003D2586D1
MLKWNLLNISAGFFLGLFLVADASAAFRISPNLLVRQEYNDNIDLRSEGELSDFITTIMPGVRLTWETRPATLSLDYSLRFKFYLDHDERNETSLRQTQRIDLGSTFHLYRNMLFLSVSNVYERVTIDEGDRTGIDSDLVNLTDSNRLRVNPYFVLEPTSTLSLRTDYIYENVWYERDIAIDYERHTGRVQMTKEISPRVQASVSGSHSLYRPKENPLAAVGDADQEFDRTDARVSLIYAPTQRLTFDAYYSRGWVDYTERPNQTLDLFGGGFRYLLGPEKVVGARYDETTSFSVRDGLIETKRYEAFIEFTPRVISRWSVFYREADYLIQDRQDDSRGVSVSGEWPWTNRMGLSYLVLLTRYDRSGPGDFEETYNRYGTRLGIYRDMRLGRFHLGHTWNKNDSDIPNNDYVNNIVWAEMRFVF